MTRTGYCPSCQQNVLLIREEINIALVVLLLIFTVGIGLIIYLIIYYNKEEDKCIHCKTIVTTLNVPYSQTTSDISLQNYQKEIEPQGNYCPFCGEQLRGKESNFCSNCGSKI